MLSQQMEQKNVHRRSLFTTLAESTVITAIANLYAQYFA